jgi:hypothetical protein
MRDFIVDMANNNIGSLCLFLKSDKNSNYLEYLNSNLPDFVLERNISEKVYYFVNNITKPLICICGDHLSFIGFKNGYRVSCGKKKCFVEIRKATCIEKWGVDNPKKSKDVLEKQKERILEKWGGEHYMCNDEVRTKFKDSMFSKWGVEWPSQSDEIKEKSKSTWFNNENRDLIIQKRGDSLRKVNSENGLEIESKRRNSIIDRFGSIEEFNNYRKEKIKEKSIEKWGVEHHLSHPDIVEKRIDSYKKNITEKIISNLPEQIVYIGRDSNIGMTDNIIKLKCLVCCGEFSINRQYLVSRKNSKEDICLNCNPKLPGTSKMEQELFDFIRNNYNGSIEKGDKTILKNREIDILLPELNLAFEFNGLYWHSEIHKDNNYHNKKTTDCLNEGIKLLHIWEDDWLFKKDIIKSIILNKLGVIKKIWARKCEIKYVDNKEVRIFLNDNHIQGFVGSSVKLGLYYEGVLVSLMTFGALRKSLGTKSSLRNWELLRFCNKIGFSVVGGASKLFKYFLSNNEFDMIVSYSDNGRGVGELYTKLGFEFVHNTTPNYYYIVGGKREHRFNFRKDLLVKKGFDTNKTEKEIMNELGYLRVFDSGSKKWIFRNQNI